MTHSWDFDDYRQDDRQPPVNLSPLYNFLSSGPSQEALASLKSGVISTRTVGVHYWNLMGRENTLKQEFVSPVKDALTVEDGLIVVNEAVVQGWGIKTPAIVIKLT